MGKRKYSGDKEESPKKSKFEESNNRLSQKDVENEELLSEENTQNEARTPSNRHGFDVKHFRKELSTKQGQTMGKNIASIFNIASTLLG